MKRNIHNLEPKPHQADPEGLQYAHPDRMEPPVIIELTPNPLQQLSTQEILTSMFIQKIMEDLLVMLLDLEDHQKY
jgi:hypothetical protein